MILTVALNPAVDKICRLTTLAPGQVNRLTWVKDAAGGKAVNVAKVLRQFHMPVAAVGFLGGRCGRFIQEALEQRGVECHFTQVEAETRTTVNLLEKGGRVTELLEPGPVVSKKAMGDFFKQFAGCLEHCRMAVLSGSLPAGAPPLLYGQLIGLCKTAGCKVLLDASGEALRLGVEAGPDLVKPNRKELEYLAGRPLLSGEELEAAARELLAKGAKGVAVSLGEEGLLYVDKEKTLRQEAKKVRAVNTVGCGDTAAASLCMSVLAGEDMETALCKAAALAAANAVTWEVGEIPMETYLSLL